MLTKETKIYLFPKVLIQKRNENFSLYNKANETVIELNSIGMEIAEYLKTPSTFSELISFFSKKYNTSPEKIRNDIQNFIETCQKKGFFAYKE